MSRIAQPTTSSSSQQQKSIVEIYTDWANHYLDKLPAGRRRGGRLRDLRTELSDGVALADVIEAATGQPVQGVVRQRQSQGSGRSPPPLSPSQSAANVQACLDFLLARGVAVGDVSAAEVRDGNLKAILGLFFQLSRFKQQQKQLQQQQQQQQQIASRCGTPKIPSVPPSPARTSSIPSPKKPNLKTSSQTHLPQQPSSRIAMPTRQHSASQLRPPSSNSTFCPSPAVSAKTSRSAIPSPASSTSSLTSAASAGPGRTSMLQRFGLKKAGATSTSQLPTSSRYGEREKGLGKRTSSSSGFSSAASANSNSSAASSNNSSDTNFPSPSALRRISNENSTFSPVKINGSGSPKTPRRSGAQSGIRPPGSGLPCAAAAAAPGRRGSPKRGSPKFSRASPGPVASATEIKDYGMIDQPSPPPPATVTNPSYPPHANKSQQQATGIPRIPSAVGRPAKASSGIPSPHKSGEVKASSPPAKATAEATKKTPEHHQQQRALQQVKEEDEEEVEEESRTGYRSCSASLPRQLGRRDASPASNVAVVSPMPNSASSSPLKKREEEKAAVCGGEDEDEGSSALKSLVPMAPLFRSPSASAVELVAANATVTPANPPVSGTPPTVYILRTYIEHKESQAAWE